ncbi:MAG: hypothetical protein LQ346_008612 [Caloplaca aetnensis]|nr:MAG: hypothetical protein LQ346_008612 [Caloplaca aetnensis]
MDAQSSEPASPTPPSSRKRKRTIEAAELEVDVNAPEPPSKKALRKAKRAKSFVEPKNGTVVDGAPILAKDGEEAPPVVETELNSTAQTLPSKRSSHGIWIGNLPYTATKDDLRTFLTSDTSITEGMIPRIHIPVPADAVTSRQKLKSQNKGFAYVDFISPEAVTEALALSEKLLTGRRVLIKDAHNFDGRPEKTDDDTQGAAIEKLSGKPPSKRIFVGNLTFDTDKANLEEHFSQCGEVTDVHVATFEDSGKCKGYAWITFEEVAAAQAAVKGWIIQKPDDDDEEEAEVEENREGGREEDTGKAMKEKSKKSGAKRAKSRKWWVNKLKGRQLKLEFAEDASVRYKKRFGKDGTKANDKATTTVEESCPDTSKQTPGAEKIKRPPRPPKKIDARTIKPGAALAAAPRLTGGIIASKGKKITFD